MSVANLLLELHPRSQAMLIVVTHSAELGARLPRRYRWPMALAPA